MSHHQELVGFVQRDDTDHKRLTTTSAQHQYEFLELPGFFFENLVTDIWVDRELVILFTAALTKNQIHLILEIVANGSFPIFSDLGASNVSRFSLKCGLVNLIKTVFFVFRGQIAYRTNTGCFLAPRRAVWSYSP